jgi:serine/threonine protein kinase
MADPSEPPSDAPRPAAPPAPSTVDLAAAADVHEQATLAPGATPAAQAAPGAGDPTAQARPFGDYELLGEIARGGMGVVYRARERHSGRLVALKMMLADSAVDAGYVHRFILEARATGELDHPGIVAIHAWGQHEGQFFYTMDYVPGFPLSRVVRRRPLPVHRAVRYLLGIARAVAAAHQQGIVHRDLKPSNVVIDPSDQPRVLDFGLAKRHRPGVASDTEPAVVVEPVEEVMDVLPAEAEPAPATGPPPSKPTPYATEKGAVLGTPSYMAPEQARAAHREVGPAADVHALGAIFFEMLTGRPPFEGPTMMDTLIQVMEQKPPRLRALNPRVPATLEALCLRCLEKDPGDRYPDAGALADDLERRWHRAAQQRRFARLSLAAGLTVTLLFGLRIFFPWWTGFGLPAFLSSLAEQLTEFAGAMMQNTASIFAYLLGLLLILVPFLCLLAFLVWLGAWLRYTVLWRDPKSAVDDASELESEPYLKKLFSARGESAAKAALKPQTGAAIELADVELGKTLQHCGNCLVRRGHQKSLDRPVLVWLNTCPVAPGAPAPGVVVHHPSVLTLHAVGACADGRFLVTSSAAAIPLAELLERSRPEPLEAAFLVVKVASAIQAFHDQGACHGRLSCEWVLVQGDLEPLLCPCGVPSQAEADRAADVTALGRLLQELLPPRPRRWRGQPLGLLYAVVDAAIAGAYARPVDLAGDVERAARAAHVRWWNGMVNKAALVLFALPLLFLTPWLVQGRLIGVAQAGSFLMKLGESLADHLFLVLAPSATLLGCVHGRGLAHYLRLRLLPALRGQFLKQSFLPGLVRVVLLTVLPALIGCYVRRQAGEGVSGRALLLGASEILGFWLLGAGVALLYTFAELVEQSVRPQPAGAELAIGPARPEGQQGLPSPQEAARTLGGRTRW